MSVSVQYVCARVEIGCAREDSDSNQSIKFKIPGSHIHTRFTFIGIWPRNVDHGYLYVGTFGTGYIMIMYIISTVIFFTMKKCPRCGGKVEVEVEVEGDN